MVATGTESIHTHPTAGIGISSSARARRGVPAAGRDGAHCFSSGLYQKPFYEVELPALFIYLDFSSLLISASSLETVRSELEVCPSAASRQKGRQLGSALSWKI